MHSEILKFLCLKLSLLCGIAFCACSVSAQDIDIETTQLANRGAALVARGKFYEAEQYYRLAIRRQETQGAASLELRLALAGVVARQGVSGPHAAEIGRELERLVKERPDSIAVLAGAAAGFSFLQQSKRSAELFERAAMVATDTKLQSVAYRNRATVLLNAGEIGEGLCASRKGFELSPSGIEASSHVSELSKAGDLRGAVKFGEQALTDVGPHPELLTRIAAAYIALKDCTSGMPLLRRVLEQGRAPEGDLKNARVLVAACESQKPVNVRDLSQASSWPIQMQSGLDLSHNL